MIPRPRPFRRRLAVRFAAWMRWLHIYLSMFGLASVLFFSVTGLTLNHPDWFFANREETTSAEGRLDPAWVARPASSSAEADTVSRLEVVERLRSTHGVRGALVEFRVEPDECLVTFKGPGYAADAFIDRDSGNYTLSQTEHGLVAVLNDLHKGRDTGRAWSLVIDVSAVFMTVISLTGLVLLFYLKLRRVPGVVVAVLGAVALVAVVLWFVP